MRSYLGATILLSMLLLHSLGTFLPLTPVSFDYDPRKWPTPTPIADPPYVTGLANLRHWPQLRSQLAAGDPAAFGVIAVLGDSWISNDRITSPLIEDLRGEYGDAGAGYASIYPQNTPPKGVKFKRTGNWIDTDQLPSSAGIDIAHSWTNDAGTPAGAFFSSAVTEFRIHYLSQPGGGSLRYRVDEGNWRAIDTDSTASTYSVEIVAGLDGSEHALDLEIDHVGSAGVTLMGIDCRRTAPGIRLHKLGNGGLTAGQAVSVRADLWQAGLAALAPNVVMILVGTNDDARDISPSTFSAQITTLIERIRTATPDADIVLIAPGDNGLDPGTYRSTDYVAVLHTISADERVTLFDLYEAIGPYAEAFAAGLYSNTTHLSPAGGELVSNLILHNVLGVDAP